MEIVKGPYLQWPTQRSVCVMWETSGEATSELVCHETESVHYGLDGQSRTVEKPLRTAGDSSPRRIHRLVVDGLEPETLYHYRVCSERGNERVESDLHPLKTAVGQQTPFSFAVTSETGGYGDDAINRRLFAQIARHRPDFLIVAGDAVGRGSEYDEWERWFFGPARKLLHSTPFYLCPGNHEEDSPWFYDFVAYPDPKNYYAFDYGGASFLGLDSTRLVDYVDGDPVASPELTSTSPQWQFAERSLARSDSTWKIVFFHYPPYVSGDYQVEQMRALSPLFDAHSVDLVFNSHTIVYERSHPLKDGREDEEDGTVYVVAGGAGAKPNWLHPKRAWHTAHSMAVPHFVQVSVANRTLELRAVDEDGAVFDWLTLRK